MNQHTKHLKNCEQAPASKNKQRKQTPKTNKRGGSPQGPREGIPNLNGILRASATTIQKKEIQTTRQN